MEKQKTKPSTSTKGQGNLDSRQGEKTSNAKNPVKAPKAPTGQTDKEEDRNSKDRSAASRTQNRVTNADEQKRTVNASGNDNSVEDEESENENYNSAEEEDEEGSSTQNSVENPSKESDDSEKIRKEQPKMK